MATENGIRAWWLCTQNIALRQKQPQKIFCKKRPESCNFIKKKNTLAQVFSCCEFFSKNTFLQTTSGQLLILLCDFIFEPFSMIDFISPTNKDHYIKCICSKCFWEGITKSWIYYQFVARTVVNKYFNNEQKHTNDSVRKELVDFKKRQ